MVRWMITMFLLLQTATVNALQIKNAVDNETVAAKISSLDVTRIFVQGDRIKSLKGVKGAYTRENDEQNGEVYLQPTAAYQQSAFTVLVETEKGRHFTLLLTPIPVPADTLMLVPKGVGRKDAIYFEQAAPYELTLVHLLHAMVKHQAPSGYVTHEINDQKTYRLGDRAIFRLKTVYQGYHLRGEVFVLTNKKPYAITLDERSFYTHGTRAISLSSAHVAPYATITLYRILRHAP